MTLPSLAWKCFNCLRDESDEIIYTYRDSYRRWFVRQNIDGGSCTAFKKNFKSKIAEKIFETISEKLNVKGNICEVFEANVAHISKNQTKREKKYDSNFDDYRMIDVEEKEILKKGQLIKLRIHFEREILTAVLMDFDATSLYPLAMWDEKTVHSKIELVCNSHK